MGWLPTALEDVLTAIKNEHLARRVSAAHALAFLTYRCTCKCRVCNIWKRGIADARREMDSAQWLHVINAMKDYGIRSVELFGGDVFLRKDLVCEIIGFCRENGIKTFLPTNGILLDRPMSRRLVEAGLDVIYFSVDDIGPRHDAMRGNSGAFSRVREAIENISQERKAGGPRIIVCTTISNMNYRNFEALLRHLAELQVDAIYPRVVEEFRADYIEQSAVDGITPEPYFMPSDGASHLLNEAEAAELLRNVRRIQASETNGVYVNYRDLDGATMETFTRGVRPLGRCMACSVLVTLDPYGNVVPCPMYDKLHMGNLLRDPLDTIWGCARHLHFIEAQRNGRIQICRNCSLSTYYPSLRETLRYYSGQIKRRFERTG